jgi:hypothetical protein
MNARSVTVATIHFGEGSRLVARFQRAKTAPLAASLRPA